MSGITSHVLDTALGRPAAGMVLTLAIRSPEGTWAEVATAETDADGRVGNLLADHPTQIAEYRLRFDLGTYFEATGRPSFYPHADVHFRIGNPADHYHVPLLVSPFGYTTYRGS